MERQVVHLTIAGQSLRVVSTSSREQLGRLAAIVEERMRALDPQGRGALTQTLLLTALALANDLDCERAKRLEITEDTRRFLATVKERVDVAIAGGEVESAGDGDCFT